jgi:ATP-binding cassette subfamily B protein
VTWPFATRRRLFAPEVIQSSDMDCGPAALKCLLDGHGIPVNYGRMREACETEVDGTSIDTIENVAVALGLDAEQVMVPVDHVLVPAADLLPALAVTRLPNGIAHFVVLWRRQGSLVQVMDPATGRRWTSCRRLIEELYVHEMSIDESRWLDWARSDGFQTGYCATHDRGRFSRSRRRANPATARQRPGWLPLAALDAATRLTTRLVESGGLRRKQAVTVLERLAVRASTDEPGPQIPATCWTVRQPSRPADVPGMLILRGAVLVPVRGRRRAEPAAAPQAFLPPVLAMAVQEAAVRPGRQLLAMLKADGALAPLTLGAALVLASAGLIVEALLFRGALEAGRDLGLSGQRWMAVGVLLILLAALLGTEWSIATIGLRLGRKLEMRLRVAFLEKLPRLGDRFLRSRLDSDMAERSHRLERIRAVPELGTQIVRACVQLILTAAGIVWLDPESVWVVAFAAAGAVVVPFAFQPQLIERDLRLRSHAGSLSRYYLDSLLGLVAIRAHGAERAIQREHESLLVEWGRAGMRLQRTAVATELAELTVGFGCAALLVIAHWSRAGDAANVLLLAYWALNLPAIGSDLALAARQYPAERNVMLRAVEPLGAPDDVPRAPAGACGRTTQSLAGMGSPAGAVTIAFEDVGLTEAGRTILEHVSIAIPAGAHLAIVGASGAGKSSLAGLLLGWTPPSSGRIVADGRPLDAVGLEALRRATAWVDPEAGSGTGRCRTTSSTASTRTAPRRSTRDGRRGFAARARTPAGRIADAAAKGAAVRRRRPARPSRARPVRDHAPGLNSTSLRGLDREHRRTLLAAARRAWADATLLCITHDVAETLAFGRVLVIENGRLAEDGAPAVLAADRATRYRAMLDAEQQVRVGLWGAPDWRPVRIEAGRVCGAGAA